MFLRTSQRGKLFLLWTKALESWILVTVCIACCAGILIATMPFRRYFFLNSELNLLTDLRFKLENLLFRQWLPILNAIYFERS